MTEAKLEKYDQMVKREARLVSALRDCIDYLQTIEPDYKQNPSDTLRRSRALLNELEG